MQPRNEAYRDQVLAAVDDAAFIQDLGLILGEFGPGWCESRLPIERRHLQQDGYVHAGVQATVADHTAGAAGFSLIAAGELVLTVEFKVNLLRPALGERLRCRSQVLRPGRRLLIAESEVYTGDEQQEKLTAKATVTLAVVPRPATAE